MNDKPHDSVAEFENALTSSAEDEQYVLRLYVTGMTPRSTEAVASIKAICKQHLQGRYDLEVIDIYKYPTLAKDEQIIAVPTLDQEVARTFATLYRQFDRSGTRAVGLGPSSEGATRVTDEQLQADNAELQRRLEEAEETIRAIQSGAVDAFVVYEGCGPTNLYARRCRSTVSPARRGDAAGCCNIAVRQHNCLQQPAICRNVEGSHPALDR